MVLAEHIKKSRIVLQLLLCMFLAGTVDCAAQENRQRPSSTSLLFNDDTAKLQFAIIADLWGGRRAGVFEDAVAKLQLLQPQLVLSVGDLVDGKTYDPIEIARQWDEFDAAIKPLTMPFFYVPGNHDIGNTMMENEWKKRLGSPYYHFVYKNVLFLCINTEDGGRGGIREQQINYFKKAIEENSGVRWTFLFMHRPVWQGKGDRQEGYEKIESLLKGRDYTLFSGHHHTYLSLVKNGNKHFVLGSTGGGSDLRGEKFGEFDHLTMVTLTKGAPKIINLKLDGIIKEDIVNEQTHPITETLINEKWLTAIPKVSDLQKVKALKTELLLENPTPYPLSVSGKLPGTKQYQIKPDSISLVIGPGKQIMRAIEISGRNGALIDLRYLSSVNITLRGEYEYKDKSYSLPANKKLLLSWKYLVQPLKQSFDFFAEGTDTSFLVDINKPEYLHGPWYWSGANDCRLRFTVLQDGEHVYVRTLLQDDQWTNNKDVEKDMVYLYLEDASGRQQLIELAPGETSPVIKGDGAVSVNNLSIVTRLNKQVCAIEFKIPITAVVKKDRSLRMNMGYRDQDTLPEKQASTLFWKPIWRSGDDYKDSGAFIVK